MLLVGFGAYSPDPSEFSQPVTAKHILTNPKPQACKKWKPSSVTLSDHPATSPLKSQRTPNPEVVHNLRIPRFGLNVAPGLVGGTPQTNLGPSIKKCPRTPPNKFGGVEAEATALKLF